MDRQTNITALVVAAGSGSRAGDGIPKQYRMIAGKSVLAHAVDSLLAHPGIAQVQVVIGQDHHEFYEDAMAGRSLPPPVIGGTQRRHSVEAGLESVRSEYVLIHDAARPFVPFEVIDRLIKALERDHGAVPVLPVVDTLARMGEMLGDTIDRTTIVRVQTPQAFRTETLVRAHRDWPDQREATDDAQMLRAIGHDVALVAGDPLLEKLTYEVDFELAAARLATGMISRTGMGFDVHAFGGTGPVWLGGIAIPYERGLAGHSDADVALHALTDALLGAAALGDIGDHFPPSDPQWKGAASRLFLEHAATLIRGAGGVIDHVDLTIICEAPRIGPHRLAIRSTIAELLRLPVTRVSVKATTTERLGFTGRTEGIAAQAVATIRMKDIQ